MLKENRAYAEEPLCLPLEVVRRDLLQLQWQTAERRSKGPGVSSLFFFRDGEDDEKTYIAVTSPWDNSPCVIGLGVSVWRK